MNVPVAHAASPLGKARGDHWLVFCLLERNREARAGEIVGHGLPGKIGRRGNRRAARGERFQRARGDGAFVLVGQAQPARSRPPGKALLFGDVVEIELGEAAAVIVAGAKEEHRRR
jgi:hypothetical protein